MKKNSALIDTGYVSNYILDYFKKRGINFIIRSFKEEENSIDRKYCLYAKDYDIGVMFVVASIGKAVTVCKDEKGVRSTEIVIDRKSSINRIFGILSEVFTTALNAKKVAEEKKAESKIEASKAVKKAPVKKVLAVNDNGVSDSSVKNVVVEGTRRVLDSRGANICYMDDKQEVIGLKYGGEEAKSIILHLSNFIWSVIKEGKNLNFFTKKEEMEEFILRQSKNLYTFCLLYLKPNTRMRMSMDEIGIVGESLSLVGDKYGIKRYVDMARSVMDDPKRKSLIQFFVSELVKALDKAGISVDVQNSHSSNSVYLMVDNRRLKTIRVSDHVRDSGSNILCGVVFAGNAYKCVIEEDSNGNDRVTYFVQANTSWKAIDRIVAAYSMEKTRKIAKMGARVYNEIGSC